MPKYHKKQSKRMTCRRRFKIVRKVAEHNRKLKKGLKKNPSSRKPKDPGVPNSLPFKDEILREAEIRKQRAIELKEAQKANRLNLQMEKRCLNSKSKLNKEANPEVEENVINYESSSITLQNIVDNSDIIIEVLDARDPQGCRSPKTEEVIIRSGKKLVLVLNKIDLIPRKNLDVWLNYLRQYLPTVAFKASTKPQDSNMYKSKPASYINECLQSSTRCVGASFFLKVLKNYCDNCNVQSDIKIGVVGYPGVGKSSFITSLKQACSSKTDATLNEENSLPEFSLEKHIKLIDCPGVIIAEDDSESTLALRNVNVVTLKDVITPAEIIVERADHTQLCLHYTIPQFKSCEELLSLLAKRMGKYMKGGVPNINEGARRLINDWNRGAIKYYTVPPENCEVNSYLTANVIEEMSKNFKISESDEEAELNKAPRLFPSNGVVLKRLF